MNTENTKFNAGDEATFILWTDAKAGWIKAVSADGKMVVFEFGDQKLLNGCNSGEPDALQCTAGGFCGHVSGKQRWSVTRSESPRTETFRLRKNGRWLRAGQSMYAPGGNLILGHAPYYDFNF